MTASKTGEALHRLRVADPARHGLDDARWPSASARATLDRIVADPADADEGVAVLPGVAARMRRRWSLPLAAAVVVLVIAGAVTFVATRAGSGTSQIAAGPSGSATAPATDQGNKKLAIAAAEALLADAPTLPGARAVGRDPSGALSAAPSMVGSPNVVDRAAFWTAPGTMADAISYLKTHLPAGWAVAGWGSGGQMHGAVTSRELFLGPPAGTPSEAYTQTQLLISVVPYHRGVAVRADAQAIWLPARTAAEHIPVGATSVDVVVTRPKLPTVRRTLTGAALDRLAEVVNAQSVATPLGPRSCPAAFGRSQDALTFHASTGTITITVWHNGCSGVTVAADGSSQPALNGVGAIDTAVRSALGLPASYRIG